MEKWGTSGQQMNTTAGNLLSEFEEEELEVEDEDDEEQRKKRIQSLKNQDLLWKTCKEKYSGKSNISKKGIQAYITIQWKRINPHDFSLYFSLFSNLNRGSSQSTQNSAHNNNKQGTIPNSQFKKFNSGREQENDEEYETPGEDHGIDEHMKFHSLEKSRLSVSHKKLAINNSAPPAVKKTQKTFKIEDYQEVNEFYTPDQEDTPLDGDFGIEEGMNNGNNQQQSAYNKAYEEQQQFRKKQAELEQKEIEKQKIIEEKKQQLLQPLQLQQQSKQQNQQNGQQLQKQSISQQQQQSQLQQQQQQQQQQKQQKSDVSTFKQRKEGGQLTMANLQSSASRDNSAQERKRTLSQKINSNGSRLPNQGDSEMKSPIRDSNVSKFQGLESNASRSSGQESNALRFQGLESNAAKSGVNNVPLELGQDEISNEQREYLVGEDFRFLVKREIIPDLRPEKELYDNDEYIIISKESKWNRIYLKRVCMYIQLRIFASPEAFTQYIEGYDKIIAKFPAFMPSTVFKDKQAMLVIQKLGDFSLYDLSNLILIESKSRPNVSYERSYLQVLSGLFNSLIVILSSNYYIGNISPKNIFVSKTVKSHVLKFSNLVDFSFDYNSICDKNYASVTQPKPPYILLFCYLFIGLFQSENEIWFSELHACCRSMQEMIDRDKYYLQKKNIREFTNRHKTNYPKIMNILSFFLQAKGQPSTDQIRQFLNANIDNFLGIGLSDRSSKHIQSMIKSSKLHLREDPIDISIKDNELKLFFFVQQFYFNQDFGDEEIKYMLKYLNRVLYSDVLEKATEISETIHQTLEVVMSDASIFRRDKQLQRNMYAVYIMYLLRSEKKVDKCMPFWKYMSQTTSLVENTNPISLYYVGLFNQLMLDATKSSKYFAFCSDCAEFEEDLVPSSDKTLRRFQSNHHNLYDDYYDDEDYGKGADWRKGKKRVTLPPNQKKIIQQQQVQKKRKGQHILFTSFQEADNTSLLIREAYGILAQIKYAFLQETSIKKIESLLKEARIKIVHKALGKVIELELQITQSLKASIITKIKQRQENMFFVEQVSTSPGFQLNSFAAISKAVSNQITLTDNLKRQSNSAQDSLMAQVAQLLSSHAQLQAQIVDAVSYEKRILNYSADKYKGNILNYFNSRMNGDS